MKKNSKINLLTKEVKEQIKAEIKKLLTGEIEQVEIDTIPPSKLGDLIEEYGGIVLNDDFDTNGWDYDYWLPFTYNGVRYTIFGGGYYGGVKVYKDTDYED